MLVVNSTIARNLAIAHTAGGVWARGDLMVINSTVTDNYAEGEGGGLLAAGSLDLVGSTVSANIAPVAVNLGAGGLYSSVGSVVGPAFVDGGAGDTRVTRLSCRVYGASSFGHNLVTDPSCSLRDPTDLTQYTDPVLGPLEGDPTGRVMYPRPGSPVLLAIPTERCVPTNLSTVPAGHLLGPDADTHIDFGLVVRHDQLSAPRTAAQCDIGEGR